MVMAKKTQNILRKQNIKVGKDISTPDGWGEVTEVFSNGSFMVEFPNRKRKIYFVKDLQCPNCGKINWKRTVEDFGEGNTAVYTCRNCDYEEISIAEMS